MDASIMAHFHDADELEVSTEARSDYVRIKLGSTSGWLTIWLSPSLAERVVHAITDELVPFEERRYAIGSELGGELDQELGER